jgi:hypothetical protein
MLEQRNTTEMLYTFTPSGLSVPRTAAAALNPAQPKAALSRQTRRFLALHAPKPRCRSKLEDGTICGKVISANKSQCRKCADSTQALALRAEAAGLVLAR